MSLRQFWIQIQDLTLASMKSRYRKTWAGFIWVVLNPLLMFGVQGLVFRKFLRVEMPDYLLFLLGGLLPWIFFTTTVQMGTPVFVSQSQLLRSFRINPWVLLGAQVLDGFANFLASFVLIMLPFYLLADRPVALLVLLPLALVPLLVGTLSITVTLSILNVFHRDINFVTGFLFSLLFFLTPIFYPRELVPAGYAWLVDLNPVLYFIEPFRLVIHSGDVAGFFLALVRSAGAAALFTALGFFVWKRKQNEFYLKL
jgi:lipopolysaccharide transport system permease protein